MRQNRIASSARIPRRWRFTCLSLFFIAAALLAGCSTEQPATNEPPTKDPQFTDQLGDQPIIITGGSVDVYFNHKIYLPIDGSTPPKQRHRARNLGVTEFRVYNDEDSDVSSQICGSSLGARSVITINYKIGGNTFPLIITNGSDATGRYVDIEFDTTREKGLPLRGNRGNKHFRKGAKVDSISYTGGTTGTSCTLPAAHKKVSIVIEAS